MLRRLVCPGLLLVLAGWLTAAASAADPTAADLLPASAVGYLEIPQPGKTLDLILDHPLAAQLLQTPEYQAALKTPQYERLQEALKRLEGQLGMPWRRAATELSSGGLYAGFDVTTQGVVVLSQAADDDLCAKARDTIVDLARVAGAKIAQDEHRGIRVDTIGDAALAVCGKWLVAANKPALVWLVIENHLGKGEALAKDEQFQAAQQTRTGKSAAWLYADLRLLRILPGVRQALNKKSNNPPLEILAGGIIGAIPDAPYVTASLDMQAWGLKLTTTLPCQPSEAAKKREFYLGGEARGVAPPLLAPQRTLLSLSTYRDFASLWRHAPDLFDDGINAKFAEAESGLTTLFAGRNFREDILGNLQPGMQLVVAQQEFPPTGITPAIKLPAGAIVVRMKNPEETAKIFKITFQSVVGFANVTGGMKGLDPLDLNSEKIGDALIVSAAYLPPKDEAKRKEAALHFNASPTAAFIGERFILASTRSLALELVEQVQKNAELKLGVNTNVTLDGKIGRAALTDNRGPLIAQNMLEKGHDRAAAEQEVDHLLALLKHFERSSLGLTVKDRSLELTLEVLLAGKP